MSDDEPLSPREKSLMNPKRSLRNYGSASSQTEDASPSEQPVVPLLKLAPKPRFYLPESTPLTFSSPRANGLLASLTPRSKPLTREMLTPTEADFFLPCCEMDNSELVAAPIEYVVKYVLTMEKDFETGAIGLVYLHKPFIKSEELLDLLSNLADAPEHCTCTTGKTSEADWSLVRRRVARFVQLWLIHSIVDFRNRELVKRLPSVWSSQEYQSRLSRLSLSPRNAPYFFLAQHVDEFRFELRVQPILAQTPEDIALELTSIDHAIFRLLQATKEKKKFVLTKIETFVFSLWN
jgi:hypothetical protein